MLKLNTVSPLMFVVLFSTMFVTSCDSVEIPELTNANNLHTSSTSSTSISSEHSFKTLWPTSGAEIAVDETLMFAKNYLVVLDGSGSMDNNGCSGLQTKHMFAKQALASFAVLVNKHDNLGLVAFDGAGTNVRLGLTRKNVNMFNRAVQAVGADSGTPLASAIKVGYDHLLTQAQQQRGLGEYHLVIVTDGAASAGQDPSTIIGQINASTPIQIHTIGFCIDNNHSLNQPGVTDYRAANNPAEVQKGLKAVLVEASSFVISEFK